MRRTAEISTIANDFSLWFAMVDQHVLVYDCLTQLDEYPSGCLYSHLKVCYDLVKIGPSRQQGSAPVHANVPMQEAPCATEQSTLVPLQAGGEEWPLRYCLFRNLQTTSALSNRSYYLSVAKLLHQLVTQAAKAGTG